MTYKARAYIWSDKANYRAAIADFRKYLNMGGGVRHGDQAEIERTVRDLRHKYKVR
jgi:hypothetical protein